MKNLTQRKGWSIWNKSRRVKINKNLLDSFIVNGISMTYFDNFRVEYISKGVEYILKLMGNKNSMKNIHKIKDTFVLDLLILGVIIKD